MKSVFKTSSTEMAPEEKAKAKAREAKAKAKIIMPRAKAMAAGNGKERARAHPMVALGVVLRTTGEQIVKG